MLVFYCSVIKTNSTSSHRHRLEWRKSQKCFYCGWKVRFRCKNQWLFRIDVCVDCYSWWFFIIWCETFAPAYEWDSKSFLCGTKWIMVWYTTTFRTHIIIIIIHLQWSHQSHQSGTVSMNVGLSQEMDFYFTKQKNTRKRTQNGHWKKKHLFSKLAIKSGEIHGIEHYDSKSICMRYLNAREHTHAQNWDFKLYLGHTPGMAIIFMRFLFIKEWKVQFDVNPVVLIKFYGRCWYFYLLPFSHFFWKFDCFHFYLSEF